MFHDAWATFITCYQRCYTDIWNRNGKCWSGVTLRWRHHGPDGVSNHQRLGCLFNCQFRRRSNKTSKLRVIGLCAGDSPVNSPHKWPVTRKMFPFDDVIMRSYWQSVWHDYCSNMDGAIILACISTPNKWQISFRPRQTIVSNFASPSLLLSTNWLLHLVNPFEQMRTVSHSIYIMKMKMNTSVAMLRV